MSHLYLPNGKLLLPANIGMKAEVVQVQMPVECVQALFELIGYQETTLEGEDIQFRATLKKHTDLVDKEIDGRVKALHNLYEYLWNQGMRPHKVKKTVTKHIRSSYMGKVLRPRGEKPW